MVVGGWWLVVVVKVEVVAKVKMGSGVGMVGIEVRVAAGCGLRVADGFCGPKRRE
jgi:hypothetical protein